MIYGFHILNLHFIFDISAQTLIISYNTSDHFHQRKILNHATKMFILQRISKRRGTIIDDKEEIE